MFRSTTPEMSDLVSVTSRSAATSRCNEKCHVPGLVNIQKAMENGHRNSGFSQLQNGDFPLLCNSLPEGISLSEPDAILSQQPMCNYCALRQPLRTQHFFF